VDVREIERLPASQLIEWMEYERLEPFGSWRDNWHSAVLASIFGNAFRDPKRPPMKMQDFFYQDPETAQERADQEILANLRIMKKSNV
jgi:hypothetical protein